jgi:hypothetical protein
MEPLGSVRHRWATRPGELSGESESTLALQKIFNQRAFFRQEIVDLDLAFFG